MTHRQRIAFASILIGSAAFAIMWVLPAGPAQQAAKDFTFWNFGMATANLFRWSWVKVGA